MLIILTVCFLVQSKDHKKDGPFWLILPKRKVWPRCVHQTLFHIYLFIQTTPCSNTIKAQVLVRWAFQHDYLSVPRSASTSKIERLAIQENSYEGVKHFLLSQTEMDVLDSLDEQLPLGRLGITDGWLASDITDENWDPTLAVWGFPELKLLWLSYCSQKLR